MRKRLDLNSKKLYVVTKEPEFGHTYETMVRAAARGGVDIIQYRDTSARSDKEKLDIIKRLLAITRDYDIPLIMNNRLDLAILGSCDGIHLGQDDIPIKEARKFTDNYSKDFIIGISTHSLAQAKQAEKDGADYIGIGPIYATPTKPGYTPIGLELAAKVQKVIKIPVFAIGGINQKNIAQIIKKGIKRVAVVRAIYNQNEDIEKAMHKLKIKN